MRIINDLLNDQVYTRLLNKFKSGEFTYGKEYNDKIWSISDEDCYTLSDKSLGRDGLQRDKLHLKEIPLAARSEEFYVNTFSNKEVYEYLKANANNFSRDFYKSVIMRNNYALIFDKNVFEIMPLEYIDEEMVTLAILCGTNSIEHKWFSTVNRRNKSAISEDVWKLAARLYGSRTFIEILDMTPEEYKDREWYLELFKCTYKDSSRVDTKDCIKLSKDTSTLMDFIPKEIIDEDFVTELYLDNYKNVVRFNEDALETVININGIKAKPWLHALAEDGDLIEYIDLNEDRIECFKNLYDIDSAEYITFIFKLREYERKKVKDNRPIINRSRDKIKRILLDAFLLSKDDPFGDIVDNATEKMHEGEELLPIMYHGDTPSDYDLFSYPKMMYEKLGIEVLKEEDYFLYRVKLPKGYRIEYNGCYGKVKDNKNNTNIDFYRDDKLYDRKAHVLIFHDIIEDKKLRKKL